MITATDQRKIYFLWCNTLATIPLHNQGDGQPESPKVGSWPTLTYRSGSVRPQFPHCENNGIIHSMFTECLLCAKHCVSNKICYLLFVLFWENKNMALALAKLLIFWTKKCNMVTAMHKALCLSERRKAAGKIQFSWEWNKEYEYE